MISWGGGMYNSSSLQQMLTWFPIKGMENNCRVQISCIWETFCSESKESMQKRRLCTNSSVLIVRSSLGPCIWFTIVFCTQFSWCCPCYLIRNTTFSMHHICSEPLGSMLLVRTRRCVASKQKHGTRKLRTNNVHGERLCFESRA